MKAYNVQSSLLLKAILHVLIINVGAAVLLYILNQTGITTLDLQMVLIITAIISIMYVILMYFEFIRPSRLMLHEMKALLTGKRYRRIKTKRVDEIGIISHFFNEITKNLERITTDLIEHKRMAKELDVAHQIQQNLLPQQAPYIDGLDITAKTKPAEEIGGDSFDFIENEDNIFFFLGDVTGHGVPAGLVMIMVDTLLDTFIDKNMDSRDVLVNTNKYLQPKISSTMFMTMVLFRWDKKTKKLYYTGAGHEHIVIYRQKIKKCESFKAGGIALGMVPDSSKFLKESIIPFEIGDVLILYSDGITEGENPQGELYGIKRLMQSAKKAGSLPKASLIFEQISRDFSGFLEGHIQDDDMSMMIVKHTG